MENTPSVTMRPAALAGRLAQEALEVLDVVVAVLDLLAEGEPAAVDQRGVVVAVAEDDVAAAARGRPRRRRWSGSPCPR